MYLFPLKLKKLACLIQDIVSPHCGDKRIAQCCTKFSLPNYFVMTSYHRNAGETHQCISNVKVPILSEIHEPISINWKRKLDFVKDYARQRAKRDIEYLEKCKKT